MMKLCLVVNLFIHSSTLSWCSTLLSFQKTKKQAKQQLTKEIAPIEAELAKLGYVV